MGFPLFRGITAAASLKRHESARMGYAEPVGELFRGITAAASLKHDNDPELFDAVIRAPLPRHHCRGLIEARIGAIP